MAELRQKVDDDVKNGLTEMAREISVGSPFRITRESLINEILKIAVRKYKAGNFNVTALMRFSQDQTKPDGDLPSFGGKKIRHSDGQKKRDRAYELAWK